MVMKVPSWASDKSLVPTLQVVLAFFEKRKTQRWSLIGGKQEERLYWEQWCVPFCCSSMGNACTACICKGHGVLVIRLSVTPI